ncbi:MAG: hypothetical protein RDV48_06700, partial [Candidatus Eremiobacteraeota bacterium]|nr:hypothetical protein [Candidatus Eremiobacteraeota bacterium]
MDEEKNRKDDSPGGEDPGKAGGSRSGWRMDINPQEEPEDESQAFSTVGGRSRAPFQSDSRKESDYVREFEAAPSSSRSKMTPPSQEEDEMMSEELPPELKKDPKKFIITILGIVVGLALIVGLYLEFSKKSSGSHEGGTSNECRLSYKAGDVKVKKTGAKSWESLPDNMVIASGMQLNTMLSKQNVVSISDGCNIRLADFSVLSVNRLEGSGNDFIGEFSLDGRMWVNSKNFKELKIMTKDGVVSASTGVFAVSTDPAKGTVVQCFQGSLTVASMTDQSLTLPVAEGQFSIISGSNMQQPQEVTVDRTNEWIGWNLKSDGGENLKFKEVAVDENAQGQNGGQGEEQEGQMSPRMQPGRYSGGQQGGQQGGMMQGGQQGGMMQGGQQGGMMQGGQQGG